MTCRTLSLHHFVTRRTLSLHHFLTRRTLSLHHFLTRRTLSLHHFLTRRTLSLHRFLTRRTLSTPSPYTPVKLSYSAKPNHSTNSSASPRFQYACHCTSTYPRTSSDCPLCHLLLVTPVTNSTSYQEIRSLVNTELQDSKLTLHILRYIIISI